MKFKELDVIDLQYKTIRAIFMRDLRAECHPEETENIMLAYLQDELTEEEFKTFYQEEYLKDPHEETYIPNFKVTLE